VLCFSEMPPAESSTEMLFYDGHCGLCHRAVKYVLKHDPAGNAFRFAPLQGETFESKVPASQRTGLPDSVVVLTSDGRLLIRSDAFIHILRRLGGTQAVFAGVLAVIPRQVRDLAYDLIARIRYKVFGRRDDVCPLVSPELRKRFDP
jgi:predicted DCC family thiol-disulfide oxidoreductase YuxK